jgi:hypothetical protein
LDENSLDDDEEFDIQSASDSGDSFDSDFGRSSEEEQVRSDARESSRGKEGVKKRVRFRES